MRESKKSQVPKQTNNFESRQERVEKYGGDNTIGGKARNFPQ
jgi:hypothetical protein